MEHVNIRPLSEAAATFLEGRGLDSEFCVAKGLGSYFDKRGEEWVVIPFSDGAGSWVRYKFRKLADKDFRQHPRGAPKYLWNREALDDPESGALVITEGEMDALAALWSSRRAVAFADGAPGEREDTETAIRFEAIATDIRRLRDERQVVIAVDDDEPGRRLYRALVARIGGERCYFVTYPDGCKDLNDVLLQHGQEGVRLVIDRAKPHVGDSKRRLAAVPPQETPQVFRAGIPFLDDHVGFVRGHVSVWTGVPSHGKTTFLNWLTACLVERYGWTVAFASFEQDPRPYQEANLRALYRSVHRHGVDANEAGFQAWANRHFTFITAPEELPSKWHEEQDLWADLQWVMETAKAAVVQDDIAMLVVDPWNEIEHNIPRNWTETNYIGFALRQVRRMARALNIHVALVAHPRKMPNGEKPTLYDISGSSNWANKVDLGVTVWRDRDSETTELHIGKVRYEELLGARPNDALRFQFDPVSRRYSVLDTEE